MTEYLHRNTGLKAKSIKSILRKKVDAWLTSIENEEVRDLAKANTIITGGCIASMLMGEPVNDYDLYFRNKDTAERVAGYYVNRFNSRANPSVSPRNDHVIKAELVVEGDRVRVRLQSAGVASEHGSDKPYQYFESRPDDEAREYLDDVMGEDQLPGDSVQVASDQGSDYRPVFISDNAITLSGHVQIVLRFHGEPDQIHANYDFVHCTNYWTSKDGELRLNPEALESLLARELRYVGSMYPLCSLIRIRKFVQRGWRINAGQILKACLQLNDLDLTDIRVLEDQLTGVDAAYFVQVIDRLKEKDSEKVNAAYLVEIIDRMF
jgi:hypothetical protein